MRWIEDKTFLSKDYQTERKRLEEKSNEMIKKHCSDRKEADKIKRMINSYLTGNIDKTNVEGLANYLYRSGVKQSGVRGMYFDPEYDELIKDLISLHDQFLEGSIINYDFASPKDLERDRQREIQMYGSLISGLISNSKSVRTIDEPYRMQHTEIELRREELIPHDRLFEYGKKTLKLLSSNPQSVYPRHLYEDLLKELRYRVEALVKMSNETYADEKIKLLNDSKIKQDKAKRR